MNRKFSLFLTLKALKSQKVDKFSDLKIYNQLMYAIRLKGEVARQIETKYTILLLLFKISTFMEQYNLRNFKDLSSGIDRNWSPQRVFGRLSPFLDNFCCYLVVEVSGCYLTQATTSATERQRLTSYGGVLDLPAALSTLLMVPGERFDIISDFGGFTGKTLTVRNNAKSPYPKSTTTNLQTVCQIMLFCIGTVISNVGGISPWATSIAPIPNAPVINRQLTLNKVIRA